MILNHRMDYKEDLGHILHHRGAILLGGSEQLGAEHRAEISFGHAIDFGILANMGQENGQFV